MSQVWHFAKLAIAVISAIIGVVVLGYLHADTTAIACGVISMAFSQLPE